MSKSIWHNQEHVIRVNSGIYFDFDKLEDESQITITDIAHALSHCCRYSGHCNRFFSVAEHCILAAKYAEACGLSVNDQLYWLLHDATEAYMADVPSPLKRMLSEYKKLEEKLLDTVLRKYGVTKPEDTSTIDLVILRKEAEVLFTFKNDDEIWYLDLPEADHDVFIIGVTPSVVKSSFIRKFESLKYESHK